MQAGATDARLDALGAKIDDLARSIDKRFEQVDKRFEQVDKHLELGFRRLYGRTLTETGRLAPSIQG